MRCSPPADPGSCEMPAGVAGQPGSARWIADRARARRLTVLVPCQARDTELDIRRSLHRCGDATLWTAEQGSPNAAEPTRKGGDRRPRRVSLRKGVFPIVPVKMTRVERVIRLARPRFRHGAAG